MNPTQHPSDLISNKLGISATLCPGIYGDLYMLLQAVKAARPDNFNPEFKTPVDDFLSRLESVNVPVDCVPYLKTVRHLNEIREKWIVGRRHG